ncbi:YtpI family protein [Priestia koreensis]|uniref:YtpI family protein n=1 Tax=Priestia koreensis TaxID=284581 RepID=UPI001F58C549|nr:YtpI family protein [Priestia koreensis]UNL84485.1 YtpI family protein [Priestia koreensis]
MLVFAVLIIASLGVYLFYKAKYFQCKKPMEKQWLSAKSSIALGFFVFMFGVNQLITASVPLTVGVGILFLLVGGGSMWAGIRAYKYYLPLALKEAGK